MFENDLRKMADVRAPTVIFNAKNWITCEKFGKKNIHGYDKARTFDK